MITDRSRRIANAIEGKTGVHRSLSPKLCALAKKRAYETVGTGGVHRPLDELGGKVGWGEVLGQRRFDPTPIPELVQGWMDSATHREILDDSAYRVIGATYVVSGEWAYFCAIVTTGLV